MNERKVGKASIIDLKNEPVNAYSDGQIEDDLLQLFKARVPDVEAFRQKHPGWATTYHLSLARTNLLNWFDFRPDSTLLEVGAGCGALTGMFTERCSKVTALELSARRAEVNVQRNKEYGNLDVVVGNLEDLDSYSSNKYDYVVCVGVLEYAGRFISGDAPFADFAAMLKAHLKPGGVVLLAIENELGLKYFSGSSEDHVRRPMEGIEGYPHYDGIRTFGKQELVGLLQSAGLTHTAFYYPLPDYKLPHTIYSDAYLPGVHTENIPSAYYPSPNPDQPREQVFSEQLAVRTVSKNGLFGDLANSFLVIAKVKDFVGGELACVYAHGSVERLPEYRTITRLIKNGSYIVEKVAFGPPAEKHVSGLTKKGALLQNTLADSVVGVNTVSKSHKPGTVNFEYLGGRSLQNDLVTNTLSGNYDNCFEIIGMFIDVINHFPSRSLIPSDQKGFKDVLGDGFRVAEDCVSPGVIDINFDNIIYNPEAECFEIIDYEWLYDFAVPKSYLITRALTYFYRRHAQIVRATASRERPVYRLTDDLLVPLPVYEKYRQYFRYLKRCDEAESSFQELVHGKPRTRLPIRRALIADEMPNNLIDAYRNYQQEHEETVAYMRNEVDELEAKFTIIENSLLRLRNSVPGKVAAKIRRTHRKLRKN